MPTIKENLLALRAAIVAHDARLFGLASYRQQSSCGTLYCSVGLAATMPFFTDQLSAKTRENWNLPPAGLGDFRDTATCLSSQASMFGPRPFSRLFDSARDGAYDQQIYNEKGRLSDKELAIARIDIVLKEYK